MVRRNLDMFKENGARGFEDPRENAVKWYRGYKIRISWGASITVM